MTSPLDDPWQVFVAGTPPTRRDRVEPWVRAGLAAARLPAAVAVALLLVGAPVGLLWARVSPRIAVSFSAQGPSLDHPESSEFFATDGSFLVVLLLVGLLTGAVTWVLTRRRGAGVPVGIAVGAVLAGLVARTVGSRLVVDRELARACRAAACDIYDGTLEVRSAGLVVVWAVAALISYAALTAVLDGESPEDAGEQLS